MRFKAIATNFIRLLLVPLFFSFSPAQMIIARHKKKQNKTTAAAEEEEAQKSGEAQWVG